MTLQIKNVQIWQEDGSFQEGSLLVRDGKIVADGTPTHTVDGGGALLCPGLIDIHTHGRVGADFCTATKEELTAVASAFLKNGITSVCPTLASAPLADWVLAATRIAELNNPTYVALHLEGNYLSPLRKGAHAEHLLKAPDMAEINTILAVIGEKLPLRVTFAPELDPNLSFTKACREAGVLLSIGHTDADSATATAAENAGINSYSHLFNAMPPLHHRKGGAVATALTGEAFTELIVDGLHIAPEMVRLTYHAKGADRLVLISDSMAGTNCPDGTYEIAGTPAILKDGKAMTPDGHLAGSTLSLLTAVQNLAAFCGIPFGKALTCATLTPAALLGKTGVLGTLAPGATANLFLLENENAPRPLRVMQNGNWVV